MLSIFGIGAASTAALLFTLWLAAGAVGLGIVALALSRPQARPDDLELTHRLIDAMRVRLRDAQRQGMPHDDLRRELRLLVSRLPKGDLRRYLS